LKGIILAGGSGTRLYPLTLVTSKQLLPVYDKPMIYYSLSTLMLAGIQDILIITTPRDKARFVALLGDGSRFGIKLNYLVQEKAEGIAQAFILGEKFIEDNNVMLILGDNLFYGNGIRNILQEAKKNQGATVFGFHVNDPSRYGVLEFNEKFEVISVEEKPKLSKSNYAITGLYIFDSKVSYYAKELVPSKRGELEITDIITKYLSASNLKVEILGRGFSWLDMGTHQSLVEATNFVKTIEEHQGIKISSPEEIAYLNGWITKSEMLNLANQLSNTPYGEYLKKVINNEIIY
jgi:glucose-1-phosphate thymidylyltransferase